LAPSWALNKENQVKHVKILGLAAIAAAALMAFVGAGTASATVLCSTTASPCPEAQKWPAGTAFDFSLESGTSLVWQSTSGETLETCRGLTLTSDITSAGSSTSTVTANNTTLDWSECSWPNQTLALGALEIHNISGTSNGTVTASKEISWTFNSVLFGSCVYGWKAGKDIGTLTEGKPATFDLNTVIEKLAGSSFACSETARLIGSFTQTEPTNTTLSVGTS
jgi:hypothetical protein